MSAIMTMSKRHNIIISTVSDKGTLILCHIIIGLRNILPVPQKQNVKLVSMIKTFVAVACLYNQTGKINA